MGDKNNGGLLVVSILATAATAIVAGALLAKILSKKSEPEFKCARKTVVSDKAKLNGRAKSTVVVGPSKSALKNDLLHGRLLEK